MVPSEWNINVRYHLSEDPKTCSCVQLSCSAVRYHLSEDPKTCSCVQLSCSAVRYHLSEDPKTLKVFPIPLKDASGTTLYYDRLCVSPDGKILATTHGSLMQWLCPETGKVLDTAEKALDGDITDMAWSLSPIPMGDKQVLVLATASVGKKVKLWAAPSLNAS